MFRILTSHVSLDHPSKPPNPGTRTGKKEERIIIYLRKKYGSNILSDLPDGKWLGLEKWRH